MTYAMRLAVLSLAAFTLGGLVAAAVVPWLSRRARTGGPRARAATALAIRLLPAAASCGLAALVAVSFVAFEPIGREETTGRLLVALAALAVVLIGVAAARWVLMVQATDRVVRRWMADAEPARLDGIEAPAFAVSSVFPIVSVVGLFRPRLIVARSVLAACTADELRAILAHEQGHIDRRDNLRRALLGALPDVLGGLPVSRRLLDDWHAATEEAADDRAARLGEAGRLLLAQALVKVARLAPPALEARQLPASALYRGEGVEHRVRRLLVPEHLVPSRRLAPRVAIAVLVLAAVLASMETVHLIVEAAVHGLP
jgi:Zn-dependent protease with chaperone function